LVEVVPPFSQKSGSPALSKALTKKETLYRCAQTAAPPKSKPYAALKGRSSTVAHAFVVFSATSEVVPFPVFKSCTFPDLSLLVICVCGHG
jgi:hypothetical protein